ncbi:hypothetical protein BOX15_Mlig009613g3, partial [Macrostomum lignano]
SDQHQQQQPSESGGAGHKRPRPDDDSEELEIAVDADPEAGEDDAADELLRMDDLFGEHEALYGSSSETECTYSSGYMARQPVYACQTCQTDGPAAICYGCAKRCHEGHDLLELYSKRQLACDCGNAKFDAVRDPTSGEKFVCQLCEFKTINYDNKYNQNFAGLYCICSRPYPDPDGQLANEEMLQCTVCEDWYHSCHLTVPEADCLRVESYEELVCQLCCARLPYLRHYALPDTAAASSDIPAGSSDTKAASSDIPAGSSDTPAGASDTPAGSSDTPAGSSDTPAGASDTLAGTSNTKAGSSDTKAGSSDASSSSPATKQPGAQRRCTLPAAADSSSDAAATAPRALLMPSGWRRRLCRCADCESAYARDNVAFLTDPADSLAEFELANRRTAEEQSRPENVLRSLASAGVPHVSVQLVASAIGDFRRGLSRAMASVLADKNCSDGQPAVITRDDADRILAMMAPVLAKRARFQPPDTCR